MKSNAIIITFNPDATIYAASLRVNGRKVPDTDIDEIWSMYQILIDLGYTPAELPRADGRYMHIFQY